MSRGQVQEKIKDRILTPTTEATKAKWNSKLTRPLSIGEKVVVHSDQTGIPNDHYIRIKHNGCVTTLSKTNFQTLKGIKLNSKLI